MELSLFLDAVREFTLPMLILLLGGAFASFFGFYAFVKSFKKRFGLYLGLISILLAFGLISLGAYFWASSRGYIEAKAGGNQALLDAGYTETFYMLETGAFASVLPFVFGFLAYAIGKRKPKGSNVKKEAMALPSEVKKENG